MFSKRLPGDENTDDSQLPARLSEIDTPRSFHSPVMNTPESENFSVFVISKFFVNNFGGLLGSLNSNPSLIHCEVTNPHGELTKESKLPSGKYTRESLTIRKTNIWLISKLFIFRQVHCDSQKLIDIKKIMVRLVGLSGAPG